MLDARMYVHKAYSASIEYGCEAIFVCAKICIFWMDKIDEYGELTRFDVESAKHRTMAHST